MEESCGARMVKKRAPAPRREGHVGSRSVGVRLSEAITSGLRLEASAYSIEARQAVAELHACPHPVRPIIGEEGLATRAHNATRFSRVYVGEERGVPFLSSSDIIGLRPERGNFLSRKQTPKLEQLLIAPWTVLVSRSGTIGNVSLASPRMEGWALSEDAIRIETGERDTAGYIAAFLRSRWGRSQLVGLTYGSVIQHIEPHHLGSVWVPELPAIKRIAIGRNFVDAALKRDLANEKLDEADARLVAALNLPSLPAASRGPVVGKVAASELNGRFDATFHDPIARSIAVDVARTGFQVLRLKDPALTTAVNAVTKFRKRVYVPKGGIPLLSSKQLFQVDPIELKGLARGAHEDDLDEIALASNMIAITCSGTIGRVQIIPRYMNGWAANQHALRVTAVDSETAGYLYAWLASSFGQCLLRRYSYGSVIVEIDRHMLADIPVPLLPAPQRQRIGQLVMDANDLRDDAWSLERSALALLHKEIDPEPVR
jgi:type I restriction enzyme S subunit